MNCMGYFTCVMLTVTGNLCNKCPKWLVEQNSSYSDYFNAISGFTSNSRAPGGLVTLTLHQLLFKLEISHLWDPHRILLCFTFAPCRNFSNFFLKMRTSVISVHILVWVSMKLFFKFSTVQEKLWYLKGFYWCIITHVSKEIWVTLRHFRLIFLLDR